MNSGPPRIVPHQPYGGSNWHHLRNRGLQASSASQSINRAHAAREALIHDGFERGFRYSRKLTRHTSCVNALSFSQDGRWLASGGDDYQILLWDFHRDDVGEPSASFTGPRGNVFCIAFSASRQHVYSAGTDDFVLKYDIEHSFSGGASSPNAVQHGSAVDRYDIHEDSVRGLSCHPVNDDLILSASEDGNIILNDTRAPNQRHNSRAQGTIQHKCEMTGVEFHPTIHNLFATCDGHGAVCLRDTRMAFGPLTSRSRDGIVLQYTTTLSGSSRSEISAPEPSSIVFDREGSKLGVTFSGFSPTIYSMSDPTPLAVLSGRYNPDGSEVPVGQRSYTNSCTIKNGSFGGAGLGTDSYYAAGSDDFRGYVWHLPDVQELLVERETIAHQSWASMCGDERVVGFARKCDGPRWLPVALDCPIFRLHGHKSIVNTVQIHPTLPYIASAGVERHILLHSPSPSSPSAQDLALTDTWVRPLPPKASAADRRRERMALFGALGIPERIREEGGEEDDEGVENHGHGVEEGEEMTEEDATAIALFDSFLRDETWPDVLVTRSMNDDEDDTFYVL